MADDQNPKPSADERKDRKAARAEPREERRDERQAFLASKRDEHIEGGKDIVLEHHLEGRFKDKRPSRKPRKPQAGALMLTARQFVRARKYRWERSAGFLHHTKLHHPGLKTRKEWDQLWVEFWNSPVK